MNKHITPNRLEWTLISSRLSIRTFLKGEVILHQGDTCERLYFINKGLARGYTIDTDGRDHTWGIYFNDTNAHMTNLFVVEYDSFLHQRPSALQIEALEACELVSCAFEDVQFLYDHLKKGERFGRLMAEEAYTFLHRMMIERQIMSTKERFEQFMRETPYLLEKVPQYHIATYLGITPQHLSRLKRAYRD